MNRRSFLGAMAGLHRGRIFRGCIVRGAAELESLGFQFTDVTLRPESISSTTAARSAESFCRRHSAPVALFSTMIAMDGKTSC